jgi:hypothetical protein
MPIPLLLGRGADPGGVYAHPAVLGGRLRILRLGAGADAGIEPDLFCAAGLGDVERIRAFFSPDGRLKPSASRTGSSR